MKLSKKLKQLTEVKKGIFKPYDYLINHHGQTMHIKTISFPGDAIITFYSQNHLSVKSGKVKNNRFITSSEKIYKLHDFAPFTHKILLFEKPPYKILHQLNEADIIELKDDSIYDFRLIYKEDQLITLLR